MQFYNVICCSPMVLTHFSPKYEFQFNILNYPSLKNWSWAPGPQLETIRLQTL